MSIKLIIFDLDGVLADIKDVHYEAFNNALRSIPEGERFVISREEHLMYYDGKPTREKLKILQKNKGLSPEFFGYIWKQKQTETDKLLRQLEPDERLIDVLRELSVDGYKMAVYSNSITSTVYEALNALGIFHFFGAIYGNDLVVKPKPSPEGYMRAMLHEGFSPKETLIIEDSPTGRQAAADSGAYVLGVQSSKDVTYQNITKRIADISLDSIVTKSPWQNKKLNVLIPAAGAGSRFEKAGYTFPKPLINVRGRPMLDVVVRNLNIDANYIFLVQKEHYEKYNLHHMLRLIKPGCQIIQVDGLTEGAACTTLLARDYIDNENPLLIMNSDQFIEDFDSSLFMYMAESKDVDGTIVTFENTSPKWSYAKTDSLGNVLEVAEKKPISTHATVGIYHFARGSDYVWAADKMIRENRRVNNEFYVAPSINMLIEAGKHIRTFGVDKMYGIGTPEDLQYFLTNYEGVV